MLSVVIVCIDYSERSVDLIDRAQNRMRRSPRLHSSFRNLEAFRDVVQVLECVLYVHDLCHPVSYSLFKVSLVLFLDDKDYFFEPCPFRIKDREIHNDMPFLIYRVDLFEAAVPASHARCHNDQYRFLHLFSLLIS